MHNSLSETALRKAAFWTGLAALVAGIGMAFEYGRAMSMLHAVSLGLLAVAVSIAFVAAEMYRADGRRLAATIATIAGVAFSAGEYGSHFGYTFGSRLTDTQQTTVQNARYDGAQESTKEDKSNLELWKIQLATLLEQDAWTATTKADALQSELATLKERIDSEKSGKRGRNAGCGKECERLQNEATALTLRIAKVEQREDLSKRIEATQRILDKKRDAGAKTEYKSSKIVNQAAGFAQIAMWDDKPSESALSWTQLVLGAIIAAITTYLAPFCLSVAFSGTGRRTARHAQEVTGTRVDRYNLTSPPVAVDRMPQQPNGNTEISVNETYITRKVDDAKIDDLRRRMAAALSNSGDRLAAA